MSTLFVDTINEKTTNNGVEIPGHVLQVQQTVFKDTFSSSIGPSFVEVTGLRCNITPKSTSSKILVIVTCAGVGAQSGTVWRMRLYRTVGGSRTDLPAIADYVNLQGSNGDTHYPCTSQIDSPATTNAVTYTVSGERRSGSGTAYFNHQGGHSDEAESNIVLMEGSA